MITMREKKRSDLRRDLLIELSKHYDFLDINSFLKQYLSEYSLEEIKIFLLDMRGGESEESVFVIQMGDSSPHWLNKPISISFTGVVGPTFMIGENAIGNLDNIKMKARITYAGRKELDNDAMNASILAVNDSVKRTNKNSSLIALVALAIAALSLVIPIFQSDNINFTNLEQTNKLLQKQNELLQKKIYLDSIESSKEKVTIADNSKSKDHRR